MVFARVGIVLLLVLASTAEALDVAVGDRVQLKATGQKGVPLHKQPSPSLIGRLPDGSRARVTELAEGGHWLKLQPDTGQAGWIIERYVGRLLPPTVTGANPADERAVWESETGCRQVVTQGRRAAPPRTTVLRIATWNVRWFPDETNLPWLACAIAWLNVDVLSVNEIRDTDAARAAMSTVLLMLQSFTQGTWQVSLHECGAANAQHVGFLWNTARVGLSDHRDMWQFNARASATSSPCVGSLRPGRYAYVRAVGSGADFHIISVHSKSAATAAARAERLTALQRITSAVEPLRQTDEDIIILGDFNTMGDGTPGSADAEVQDLFSIAALETPGFVRLAVAPACTEYYQGRPNWLDHVLVSRLMAEVPAGTMARVSDYCALKACANIGTERPPAYQQLSDHCPVVVEITNSDND